MLEPSHANEGIQMLVPQRSLEVSAYLIGETGGSKHQANRHEDPPGIPVGYTNSLEDLIKEGRQFGTIYAEPPWLCELAPEPGSFYYRKPVSGEVLAALPVRQLAARSAQVYLWAPDQFLQDAIRVLEAWGFTDKGILVWISPKLATGHEWGAADRLLLYGVRCNSPVLKYEPPRPFLESRQLAASALVPNGIKSLIEHVSPCPRLHLFNEVVSMGWTSWGQGVPRPFDPDEEDDWGPDEDDDCDDETCEREPDAQGDGLVADLPMIIDAGGKPTRRMHP